MSGREIKFRAWNTETNQMIVNSPISMAGIMRDYIRKAVDPNGKPIGGQYEIMQFTGLRDSKRTEQYPEGQEIYEGDIVRYLVFGREVKIKVEWSEQYHCLHAKVIREDGNGAGIMLESGNAVEVIGNEFENPELMEEKK